MRFFYEKGFTLIEVVVAVSIISLLGFGCYQLTASISAANERIDNKIQHLKLLTRAFRIIDQDFRQVVNISLENEAGVSIPPISRGTKLSSGNLNIEFTRGGYRNPIMEKRSEMIHVGYVIETEPDDKLLAEFSEHSASNKNNERKNMGGYLVRYTWPVFKKTDNIDPEKTILMENISAFEVSFMDKNGEWLTQWPPVTSVSRQDQLMPNAIRLKLSGSDGVDIEKLYSYEDVYGKNKSE